MHSYVLLCRCHPTSVRFIIYLVVQHRSSVLQPFEHQVVSCETCCGSVLGRTDVLLPHVALLWSASRLPKTCALLLQQLRMNGRPLCLRIGSCMVIDLMQRHSRSCGGLISGGRGSPWGSRRHCMTMTSCAMRTMRTMPSAMLYLCPCRGRSCHTLSLAAACQPLPEGLQLCSKALAGSICCLRWAICEPLPYLICQSLPTNGRTFINKS